MKILLVTGLFLLFFCFLTPAKAKPVFFLGTDEEYQRKIDQISQEAQGRSDLIDGIDTPQARVEKANLDRIEAERLAWAKKPSAKIGMTSKQVRNNTNWGRPIDVNRTITRYGTQEQWVYAGNQYLYFENGRLTAIQQ